MKATGYLARLAEAFLRPVPRETRAHLAELWSDLPPSLRVPQQMIGRHAEGCGATIGTMPRCDFACTGCYLGSDANRTPALGVEDIKAQMRTLRGALGRWGNLQLTDGEVTLRPEEELIELLRYAREIELIPMLMTHGEAFRRRPGFLERLMVRGGLREVCFHVDTTQRGRKGFDHLRDEARLNPLREELAEIARRARRRTRRPLHVATTVTVTAENLPGVPALVACLVANSDVYRIASFQPAAQVGRTTRALGGRVDVDELWTNIAAGLSGPEATPEYLARGRTWFGHPDCTRVVTGVAFTRPGGEAHYHPLRLADDGVGTRAIDRFLERWGGLTLRGDSRGVAAARLCGVVAQSPWLVAQSLPGYLRHWLRRLDPERPWRALRGLAAGRLRPRGLALVSHHFMSSAELSSARGAERVDACVFRVPVEGELVSMCAANAAGVRDRVYARQRGEDAAATREPDRRLRRA